MIRRHGVVIGLMLVLLLAGCASNSAKRDTSGRNPAEVNVELGLLYMREGMKNVALEKFEKALEQDPNLPAAHNAIAVLYESLGENDKADKHFRRALSIDPKDSQAHTNYGSFLCKAGRWNDAEEHFLKAATDPLYQTPHLAYTNAGTCAWGVKDVEKAETYWRKALDVSPKFPVALMQMARLSVGQKNYMSARAYLQRLHEVTKPSPESLALGIETEQALGDKNAVASYQMLLKNSYPDSPQAKQLQGKEADERNPGH